MPSPTTVRVFESAEEVARAGAQEFVEIATNAVSKSGRFSVALAGGNTPRRMYELLAENQFRNRLDWRTVHIFFGDERFVPLDHPDSNYRMAYEALISRVDIPTANVHPIDSHADPNIRAAHYEAELRGFFSNSLKPAFDLVLLGMGDDGHTASLFPDTSALKVTDRWVVANWVEKLRTFRITLTATAINGAANVVFLVTGSNKATAIAAVLGEKPEADSLPAGLIKPEAGKLTWLLDSPAAVLLPKD